MFWSLEGDADAGGGTRQRTSREDEEDVHRSPQKLRDVPDRVRPANYGGSGEIISPDAFSAFCLFCLFAFSAFLSPVFPVFL